MKQGTVAAVSDDIALSAGLISIQYKRSMADSFIYAVRRAYKATIWTQDRDFKGLPGMNYKTAVK